jgi:hypothetical protein
MTTYSTIQRFVGSVGEVLKRVFELKDQIGEFVASKGKPVTHFNDPKWMTDFGDLTDISLHLNDLSVLLQCKKSVYTQSV